MPLQPFIALLYGDRAAGNEQTLVRVYAVVTRAERERAARNAGRAVGMQGVVCAVGCAGAAGDEKRTCALESLGADGILRRGFGIVCRFRLRRAFRRGKAAVLRFFEGRGAVVIRTLRRGKIAVSRRRPM